MWMRGGNLNCRRDFRSGIGRVTNDDLVRAARQYLYVQNLTITSVNPPGTKSVRAADQAAAGGAIKKITLANGLRLLLPEDPPLPLVSMHPVFKGRVLTGAPPGCGINSPFGPWLP